MLLTACAGPPPPPVVETVTIVPPASFRATEPKPAAPARGAPLAEVGAFLLALDAHDDACVARNAGIWRFIDEATAAKPAAPKP